MSVTMGIISGYITPTDFRVYTQQQELTCKLAHSIASQLSNKLIVGDKVVLNNNNEIQDCLPRTSSLVRVRGDHTHKAPHQKTSHVIAANIDIGIIVATTAEPKFSPTLVDRYLFLCQHGNIQPLICLNKCDLTLLRHPILKWYQSILDITVIETSVKSNQGIEELKSKIWDKASVLIGASGVGKSSIINHLLGKNLQTQSISFKNKKGRHTTTAANLYPLGAGYIIDTPGIRHLNLGKIKPVELKAYFPEFDTLSQDCKYSDCLHLYENGCAIKSLPEDHPINIRYQTYVRILQSMQ